MNPLYFFITFQAIITNYPYLAYFLVSLLSCLCEGRDLLCLIHYSTPGTSTVLGTWHGHEFLLMEPVNGYP